MTEPQAHLLVVDDDERIRGLLQKFLIRNGFLVSVARDGDQARRLLSGLEFDMVIMDVMMPGTDGISLTRELRTRLQTPILLLTAKGETQSRIEGLEAGADDYLAKPSNTDDIEAAFARAGSGGDAEVELVGRQTSIKTLEWEHIHEALAAADFNISEAARQLGMHRRTLARKLEKRRVK